MTSCCTFTPLAEYTRSNAFAVKQRRHSTRLDSARSLSFSSLFLLPLTSPSFPAIAWQDAPVRTSR